MLSDEYNNEYVNYVTDKMPIVIVLDKNEQKSRNDILKKAKSYVEDILETLIKENTIEILKEIKDFPNKQFELMMKRAIRLYLYEISKSIIDGKLIDDVLNENTISSFLSIACNNIKI
ncbi:hypothetical protein F8M41_017109 [Gigaspora margarita]|uniref:Uncharacterized protein n=1 Tax=Gigaspora margarita TaxID=4874 RepID=A0A8H4ANJ4_GIGMA|nr:hypothetical protein F8M41_017109 [Gigaspora margarita]